MRYTKRNEYVEAWQINLLNLFQEEIVDILVDYSIEFKLKDNSGFIYTVKAKEDDYIVQCGPDSHLRAIDSDTFTDLYLPIGNSGEDDEF